ncbi:MAG: arylsulfatase [Acidobacteria bacterium]|nr:arylsulfatase [Acidobacteriota bacterium]MDA1236299.1 arylsulfatase [Acidobacteriota bacterium]
MKRSVLVALIVLPAALLSCKGPTEEAQRESNLPNILLIVADDLGYGDLGSYGQQEIQTPNLDRLASEGVRFTNFYAGSTVCAPSRAALMTGQHTGHTPIRGNSRQPLPDSSVTMAETLRGAGYHTGLIGKWGLGELGSEGEPNRQGFDYFFGYLNQRHAHNYYPEFLYRNQQRYPLDNVVPEPKDDDGSGVATTRLDYSHDLFTDEALTFIDESEETPFFLALTYTIPHANNEAGELGMEVPDLGIYADKPWPAAAKGHAAMISRMDSDIGRLMARLSEKGIADNTVVLFTSDNGPHREGGNDPDSNDSNGPLRGIKRDLYEGGIRVPLIVRWPKHTPPATVTDRVGAFWDLLPTFAEIADVAVAEDLDGHSLLTSFSGHYLSSEDRTLYWEFHEGQASKQAVRMGQWKGIRLSPSAKLEVYDLANDEGETLDLADAFPDVAAKMLEYLATARTANEDWPLRDVDSPPGQ